MAATGALVAVVAHVLLWAYAASRPFVIGARWASVRGFQLWDRGQASRGLLNHSLDTRVLCHTRADPTGWSADVSRLPLEIDVGNPGGFTVRLDPLVMEFDVDDHRINLTIVAMRAPFGPGILCPPVSYDLPPGGVVHRQTFRYYPKRMNLVMAHAEVFIDFDDDPDSEGEVFPWPNPPPTPDQVAGELLPPGIHEMVMDMPPRPGVPPLPNMMTREERDRHFAEVHRRAVDGFRTWRRR